MSKSMHRTCLQVEVLEDRCTPSAFNGLGVAARFIPGEPYRLAPVFALNYSGGSETLPALRGLQNAFARLIPTEPSIPGNPIHVSPVFIGLAHEFSVDGPVPPPGA